MDDKPLRVLHLGNVANNAYLNAKLLGSSADSDVLSYAHYHIMASPEWEECDFNGQVEELHPDWRQVDLSGYRRPAWFAEGPLSSAAAYLEARRDGGSLAVSTTRAWLDLRRDLICGARWRSLRRIRRTWRAPAATAANHSQGGTLSARESRRTVHPFPLGRRFGELFPDREDQLSADDVEHILRPHRCSPQRLRRLFARYDVVHAYGAEPMLPLISGARPYIAFEHGTLRSLPFGDSPLSRLTALAYREADAVLITNADNRDAAKRLGITNYRFVPHPVNEIIPPAREVTTLREDLHGRLDADFVVFHPSRQHWSPVRDPHLEKGNDRLIEGLTSLFASRPRAAAVFVDWGATRDASRALLAARGIQDRVLWIDPIPGPALARYMAASDIVADQFFLGAFGAITPRALFLGTPALLYLNEAVHRWCFDELPPVLNAATPGEIAGVLTHAYDDRAALRELADRGRQWYQRHHSNEAVRRILMDTYRSVACETASSVTARLRKSGRVAPDSRTV